MTRVVASGFQPDTPLEPPNLTDSRLSMQRRDLIAEVTQLAASLGWRDFDTVGSRRSTRGFPDLVLWRDRVLFATIKSTNGNLRHDEQETLQDIADARAQVHVWRPIDLITGTVEHELRKR